MDPWQSSVETRLGSLERRLERIDERLGAVETSVATLVERVGNLPGKGFIVTTVIAGGAMLGAVGHYLPKLIS